MGLRMLTCFWDLRLHWLANDFLSYSFSCGDAVKGLMCAESEPDVGEDRTPAKMELAEYGCSSACAMP